MGAARVTTRWQELSFASEALADNPLGDSAERPVYVWTPGAGGPHLTIYVLQGFTGMEIGRAHV